jgi:putative intracellular protease/amidase
MKTKYLASLVGFLMMLASYAQTNSILMYIAHEETYYSEYVVMKEALESAGYSVEIRNASGMVSTTYMNPSSATIQSTANSLTGSSYAEFTTQFNDMFGATWDSNLNTIPTDISVDGRIQDVANMSTYDALVIVGGTGILEYRVDGTYNSHGVGGREISAATVQAASEKINTLVLEALSSGKPTLAQCHGASLLAYARIPGTSGTGQETMGYSILKDGQATGFPDGNLNSTLTNLNIQARGGDRVTISSPHSSFNDNDFGDFKILTTRDWYPQTVAYASRSLLNVLDSYPNNLTNNKTVLILHGGAIDESNCQASNSNNDVPCNYQYLGLGNLPADYTHIETLLNTPSVNDPFSFTVSDLNISDASLPYDTNNQNSIENYLSNYDVVVFFKHWSTNMNNQLQNALVSYVDDGGALLAMHHALYNDIRGPLNKNILVNELFGAESHESTWSADLNTYEVYHTNYGHFISTYGIPLVLNSTNAPATWTGNMPTEGANLNYSNHQRFTIYDEIYENLSFISGQTFGQQVNDITPLFSNNHSAISQSHTAGFLKLFNPSLDESEGRLVCLAAGERRESINSNHIYGQVIRNAVQWLANTSSDFTLSATGHVQNKNSILIHPNPTDHVLNIVFKSQTSAVESIVVYDSLGKEISNLDSKEIDQNRIQLNLEQLPKGLYFLKIQTENATYYKKVIKR